MGHLVRCLSLAEDARDRGIDAQLVTRRPQDQLAESLQDSEVPVAFLPSNVDIREDARQTLEFARQSAADVIITDLANQDYASQEKSFLQFHQVLQEETYVTAFVDNRVRQIEADCIIDPYVHSTGEVWPDSAKLLIGPDYFVVRKTLREYASYAAEMPEIATEILITIGGSDKAGMTVRVLEALNQLGGSGLQARVLIGQAVPPAERDRIRQFEVEGICQVRILEAPVEMGPELRRAHVAVIGDGLTKYETAFFGTPSLIIPRPDSDPAINEAFIQEGTAQLSLPVNELDSGTLAAEIEGLAQDLETRGRMAERGRRLIDGQGSDRILQRLEEEV